MRIFHLVSAFFLPIVAHTVSYTFIPPNSQWDDPNAWTPMGFPSMVDDVANFPPTGLMGLNVFLPSTGETVGQMNFNSSAMGAYNITSIGGNGILTLEVSSGNAQITGAPLNRFTVFGSMITQLNSNLEVTNNGSLPIRLERMTSPSQKGVILQAGEFQGSTVGFFTTQGDLIINGGTYSSGNVSFGSLIMNGGTFSAFGIFGELTGTGTITGTTIVGSANTSTTFSGNFDNATSFEKTGTGTLTLTGSNVFFNNFPPDLVLVSGGSLSISSSANLGGDAPFQLNSGTSLIVTGNTPVTLTQDIYLGTDGTMSFDVGAATSLTLSSPGIIRSAEPATILNKTGAGVLILTGTNTYTGSTAISAGTLSISDDDNLGDSSADLLFNGAGTLEITTGGIFSSSRSLTLNAPATIDLTTGTTATWNGAISGSSSLGKIGPGVLILTNMGNSYQDGTLIEEGTLRAGAANVIPSTGVVNVASGIFDLNGNSQSIGDLSGLGGASVTLGAATLTTGNANSNPTFAGTISGSGGLTKVGTGTFTLSGNNSYNGTTQINAGRLNILGSLASLTTNVASGATLGGTGTVQDVVVSSGGILSPGTSIGTLNIAGDLTLNSGSITQIEISPSNSSQILVSGLATLAGSVQVIQPAGSYPLNNSYPILVASGGTSGFFDPAVLGGLPGYMFTLSLSPDMQTVFLTYGFMGIPTTGLTGQARQLADYLNANVPASPVTQALAGVPSNDLEAALDSVSPSRNAFAPFAAQDTMFAWSNLLAGHLVDQRFYHSQKYQNPSVALLFEEQNLLTADASGKMVLPRTCETHSFWVGALGQYAHQDALDQNPAFHYWAGGGILGFDFYGDENLFGFGGGGAYTRVIEDGNAGNIKLASYFGTIYDTVYGSAEWPLYLELGIWGVYNQIDNERHISFPGTDLTASASFHSWQVVPHLGLGYHADYGCFSFDPFVQFDLAVDWQQGFAETGAGAFNMTQESLTSFFLRSEGGFRFFQSQQTSWGAWMIMEKVSYVNKKTFGTGSVAASIVGTSALFSVETFRNTQNLGSAGLEFLWRWGTVKPISLSVAYNGEFGSQYLSQEGMIRFIKDF